MGVQRFNRKLLVVGTEIPDGSAGGAYPTGTDRQVAGFDDSGNPAAVTLGWGQFSDQPDPPPFVNGALVMSGELDPENPEFGFVEVEFATPKPNTLVMRDPDNGVVKVADAVAAQDALSKKQFDDAAVKLTGTQTVAGVKTFSSYPALPVAAPTTARQATPKDYVDARLSPNARTAINALTAIADPATATATSCATAINAIIAALKAA